MKDLATPPARLTSKNRDLSDLMGQLDKRLVWALEESARYVSESSTLHVEALILTGSVARGEVTAVPTDKGLHCLSDMEFLVAVRNRRHWKKLSAESARISTIMRERACAQGLDCWFEFTPAPRRYFRNVKPSIFSYELRCHGKTVWGDPAYLDNIPTFSARDIPKSDAFYLICNRMVEQLDYWARFQLDTRAVAMETFSYSVIKTYIDLATSLLVFAGCYSPSYASRATQLGSLKPLLAGHVKNLDELLGEITRATALKLNPNASILNPLTVNEFTECWRQLALYLLDVWKWEIQTLHGANGADMSVSLRRFAHGETLHQQFLHWVKLARSAIRRGRIADLLRARWLRGIPRHMLYCEAARIYAECADRSEPFLPFPTGNTVFLPFRPRAKGATADRIQELIAIWRMYFRN